MAKDRKVEVEITSDQGANKDQIQEGIVSSREEASVEPEEKEQVEVKSELELAQEKAAEFEDRLLRSVAEQENQKKRSARQFDEIIRTANDRLLGEILDISDNFDRALAHAEENPKEGSFSEGTALIAKQLHDLIGKYGVSPIKAIGEKFDSSKHEALMKMHSDEFPEGMVALEVNKGYMIGDRVLRYSKVGVSSGPETKIKDENDNENETNIKE